MSKMLFPVTINADEILEGLDIDGILEWMGRTNWHYTIGPYERKILFRLILKQALDRSDDMDQDLYHAIVDFKNCLDEVMVEAKDEQICFDGNDILEVFV